MRKPFAALLLVAVALLLSACGNNYHHYGPPPGAGSDCIPPSNTVLVYPENGATDVPDATNAIYVAVPTALTFPSNFDVALTGPPTYGTVLEQGFVSVSYGSIPTPNTAPSYSNPQYYESSLTSTLTTGSVFDVYWNQLSSACNSSTNASLLGSFTTQ